jgi:hypothetical protein
VPSPVATTYTLKPDCTGTFPVQNGSNFNIFVAVDGSGLSVVATDPGVPSSERSVRVGKTARSRRHPKPYTKPDEHRVGLSREKSRCDVLREREAAYRASRSRSGSGHRAEWEFLRVIIPRVEDLGAARSHITDVSCNQIEIVFERGRCEQRVDHRRRMPGQPPPQRYPRPLVPR